MAYVVWWHISGTHSISLGIIQPCHNYCMKTIHPHILHHCLQAGTHLCNWVNWGVVGRTKMHRLRNGSNEFGILPLSYTPDLLHTLWVWNRKLYYSGHIMRNPSGHCDTLLRTMEGRREGKRGRGRPRQTWVDDLWDWTRPRIWRRHRRNLPLCLADWPQCLVNETVVFGQIGRALLHLQVTSNWRHAFFQTMKWRPVIFYLALTRY